MENNWAPYIISGKRKCGAIGINLYPIKKRTEKRIVQFISLFSKNHWAEMCWSGDASLVVPEVGHWNSFITKTEYHSKSSLHNLAHTQEKLSFCVLQFAIQNAVSSWRHKENLAATATAAVLSKLWTSKAKSTFFFLSFQFHEFGNIFVHPHVNAFA